MKVCFPVIKGEGLDSAIYGHFASAPWFLIVETTSMQSYEVANCDHENIYTGCNPFMALRSERLDGIVVGGIGDDALRTMNMCGFRVFQAQSAAVRENLKFFEERALEELKAMNSDAEGTCSDQSGERSCGHCHG